MDRFDGDPAECRDGGDVASPGHDLNFPSLPDLVMARTIDIANRLRFVCADLDPDELLALATRMAMVEVKYSAEHPELRAERRMRRTG
jgi:hypothetical protein